MSADPYDDGMRIRREVLGEEHVDRAVAATTPFTAPFQEMLTRYAWGTLTALHCRDEIALHVRAALRNGLTADEISEVLLHTAVYAGVPAANEAFRIAQDVLADEGAS
jgi:4-carboxymuconolactone decarboxylase